MLYLTKSATTDGRTDALQNSIQPRFTMTSASCERPEVIFNHEGVITQPSSKSDHEFLPMDTDLVQRRTRLDVMTIVLMPHQQDDSV